MQLTNSGHKENSRDAILAGVAQLGKHNPTDRNNLTQQSDNLTE